MGRSILLVLLLLPSLGTACRDATVPPFPGASRAVDVLLQRTTQQVPYELPPDARSRWDAPWWRMSDAELADSIEAYRGRVFIGFKEPDAERGVDDWGQVLTSDSAIAAGKELLRSRGLTLEWESVLMPAVVATVPRALVSEVRTHLLVDYIEPVGRIEFETQDTTWNVRRVRAPEAWISSTGSAVKLLIIDSGVPNDHPDLAPAVIQACDGSNGLDQNGHGTHVAGIAAAVDNAAHVIGVAHGAELWSSRVDFSSDDVYCAVEFGRVNGVSVINMSLRTTETAALTDMIKGAYADGIFMAKSAGNTDGGSVTYPGTLFETVAVTALDSNNVRADFAAIGPEVELAAPGVDVTSTSLPSGSLCSQGGYTGLCSGTSMAAPHVAAAAAILKASGPSWTNADIRDRLQKTALDLGAAGRDEEYGYGLIDIRGAIDYEPPDPPAPLDVTINGPTMVPPDQNCYYSSTVDGGSGSYSYQWYRNGVPIGDDSPFVTVWTGDLDQYTLRLDVTDTQQNAAGSDELDAVVSPEAPPCLN